MNSKSNICFTLLLIFTSLHARGQYSRFLFNKLTIEHGLSQSVVQAIVQDKYGFMWFGTNDGLNKYDGYEFKIFRKADGLSEGAIKSLLIVNDTLLWIGTKNSGIDIMSLKNYRIVKHINTANTAINSNTITDLKLDQDGNIWIATDNGINIMSSDCRTIRSLLKNKNNVRENGSLLILSPNEVWFSKEFSGVYSYINKELRHYNVLNERPLKSFDNLVMDQRKTIWVGTNNGLFYKRAGEKEFIQKDVGNHKGANFQVHHIFIDREGYIWFSVHVQGLFRFDPLTEETIWYSEQTQNSNKFDIISSVSSCQDRAGMIWIGTNGFGIEYFYPNSTFKTISYDVNAPFHTSGKSIRGISSYLGNPDRLWIGSYGGLDLFDKKKGLIKNYNHINDKAKGMICDAVYDVYQSPETGNVILGTEGHGLLVLDIKKDRFYETKFDTPATAHNTKYNFELSFKVYRDPEKNIWLGTNNGLYQYHEKKNVITPVYVPTQEIGFSIYDIDCIDQLLLMSTSKGLYVYDKQSKLCHNVSLKLNSISEPHVHSVFIDDNMLWVGTRGHGLLKYQYKVINNNLLDLKSLHHYTSSNGLPNDVVYGMLRDKKNTLWLSTNNGLVSINLDQNKLSTYNFDDGLQGNEFNSNSYFADSDGTLYFGGINGLSYFNPMTLKKNMTLPTISFTSFKIFNKPADLNLNLNEVDVLEVPYSDNVLTFSFTSADYISNKRLNYAYMLEGFNKEFIQLGNTNSITFTNLDPGNYVLKIIGTNSDGIWNEQGRSLRIRIVPPFWRTVWFNIYLVIFVLLIIYLVIRLRTRNIKQANIRLEKEVAKRTLELSDKNTELANARDLAEQSATAKSEFLATMSHEIRTPMNGVVGMVSLLENAALSQEQKNYVDIIRSSTNNLLQVINDILDFSKIDSGKLDLYFEKVNLHQLLETGLELFIPRAIEKNIEVISFICPDTPKYIMTDETRLKQILFNLVNNAIKFTPSGHIYVSLTSKPGGNNTVELCVTVTDTGIGIPEEKQARIFDLFTQADSSTSRKFGGTGLGLTICKNLVEMMGGTISVKSKPGEGASFSFTINARVVHDNASEPEVIRKYNKALVFFSNPLNTSSCLSYLGQLEVKGAAADDYQTFISMLNSNEFDLLITDNIKACKMPALDNQQRPYKLVYFAGTRQSDLKADYILPKPITLNRLKLLIAAPPQSNPSFENPRQNDLKQTAMKYPLNIMIAEDFGINQNILKRMFFILGYEIKLVENGLQALEEASKNRYDLIFMDIHMPEMDGIEATRRIIETLGADAPVIIALTASVITDEIHTYKEAGMTDVLAKPLAIDDVKSCLIKWGEQLKKRP